MLLTRGIQENLSCILYIYYVLYKQRKDRTYKTEYWLRLVEEVTNPDTDDGYVC